MKLPLGVAACLISASALAELSIPEPTDHELIRLVGQVRPWLPRAKLADGSDVRVETQAERAVPILPLALARAVVRRGAVSGMLDVCGVDSQASSFLPMMAEARRREDLAPKQLAFIGLLHGVVQGTVAGSAPPGACDAALRADLTAEISRPALPAP